jgi:hypothetical protein
MIRSPLRFPAVSRPVAVLAGMTLLAAIFSSCQTLPREVGLREYTTDDCSCGPEGTRRDPTAWLEACHEHDYRYWQGGTRQQRREADLVLRNEIRKTGNPVIGNIAYASVRLGGAAIWPTPFRWGYGWEQYPRFPRPLTEAEKKRVRQKWQRAG